MKSNYACDILDRVCIHQLQPNTLHSLKCFFPKSSFGCFVVLAKLFRVKDTGSRRRLGMFFK